MIMVIFILLLIGPSEEGIYKNGDSYYYGGISFQKGDTERMREYVGETEYDYVKINGKKYYLDTDYYTDRGEEKVSVETSSGTTVNFKASTGIFFIDSNGRKNYSQTKGYSDSNSEKENNEFLQYYLAITKNKSAYEYYKNAYEFSRAVLGNPVAEYKDKANTSVRSNGYDLSNLKASNAFIWGNSADDESITSIKEYGDIEIFGGTAEIQKERSNFNQHRKTIIRYVVETNLATSISAFSSNANTTFVMPKISEEDWETIQNDVCAISFLQGMSIGAKKYNGYSVVANTLTKEYIDENDIYILAEDRKGTDIYCKVNDKEILDKPVSERNYNVKSKVDLALKPDLGGIRWYYGGVWKINFERRQGIKTNPDGSESTIYYNPVKYLGSYTSIMGSYGIQPLGEIDMYEYVYNNFTTGVIGTYLKALGRERWGSYNVNNINYELYGNTNENAYFLKDY